MAPRRDMRERDQFVAEYFDEIIEDILDHCGDVSPQEAVDWAEVSHTVNVWRRANGREPVTLPLQVERQLIECAKRGMQRGQGRKGRRRRSYVDQVFEEAVLSWAKDRKAELAAKGKKKTGANSAEDQAVNEAHDLLPHLACSTIRRRMQRIDD